MRVLDRSRARWFSAGTIAAVLVGSVAPAGAQTPAPAAAAASTGLDAGAALGGVGVSFGDEDSSSHFTYRLDIGYRFRIGRGRLERLRLTPKLSLTATHLRGMDPAKDEFAYSSLDLGVRATYASRRRFRPYVEPRRGITQTAERLDGASRILNYRGTGTAWAFGVEIPLAPSGRGVDIGMTFTRGRYTETEYQEILKPADLRHRAYSLHIGWSGPFTGISLPWQ